MNDRTELIARAFHDAYERLAPEYGYSTRPESATRWTLLAPNHRELMCATVEQLVAQGTIFGPASDELLEAMREFLTDAGLLIPADHAEDAEAQRVKLRQALELGEHAA